MNTIRNFWNPIVKRFYTANKISAREPWQRTKHNDTIELARWVVYCGTMFVGGGLFFRGLYIEPAIPPPHIPDD